MATEMKLQETSLPQNYSKGLLEDKKYDLAPEHTSRILHILFAGAAQILAANKSKDHPVALVIDRLDGKVVAAAVLQLFENDDASNPGNWNMFWTFDEADIPENATKIYLKDPLTHPYFIAVAASRHNLEFKTESVLVNMLTYVMEILYKWLDENAKQDDEIVIVQDGVFQARVGLENGQKVFAVEPAGEIKMMIKDDSAIEK